MATRRVTPESELARDNREESDAVIAREMWYDKGIRDIRRIAFAVRRPMRWVCDVVFYRSWLSAHADCDQWRYKAGD